MDRKEPDFNAKAQRRRDAKKKSDFFAPLRLRAFALKSGHFNLFGALGDDDLQSVVGPGAHSEGAQVDTPAPTIVRSITATAGGVFVPPGV